MKVRHLIGFVALVTAVAAISSCKLLNSSTDTPVTGIGLSPTSATLRVGATQQLAATIQPSNATNQNIKWLSTNNQVATVTASGLVTAVASGSASIVVTSVDGGYTSKCDVTVSGSPSGSDYTISGTITLSSGGILSGVTVSAGSASATTDSSGNYTISGLTSGTYTIKASLSGYTFNPTSRTVTVSGGNVTGVTFTATPPSNTHSISGTVTVSTGGGLSGVTLSTGSASATTDSSGNYTISGLTNNTYTVTPSLLGYTFNPTSKSVTVNGANVTSVNFNAVSVSSATYSISGVVTLSSGGALSGVTLSTGSASAKTDSSGNYTISGLTNNTYIVTPSLSGYTFNPTSKSATVSGADLTSVNFTASPSVTYCTLTTSASPSGGGSVSVSPTGGRYQAGSLVTLTANSYSGYAFTGWSGDASGTSSSITIAMNTNKSVTGNFVRVYTLSTSISPSGGGYLSISPSGGSYRAGTQVTLTANSYSGYVFTGWSGNASGTSNPVTISMNANESVTANFVQVYKLSTSVSPSGGGWLSLSPSGGSYRAGTQVTLSANSYSGYVFTGWSGDASGTSNPITISMNANKSITANFTRLYTLTVTTAGGGSVTSSPGGISCPASSSRTATFRAGTAVTLTASPSSSHSFYQWSGALSGSSPQNTVVMNGNVSVTATFATVWSATTTQDAYVVDGTAMFTNYGGNPDLETGTIVRLGISYHSRTFLDFPVSNYIPAGATVVAATLRVDETSNTGLLPFDIWIGVPLSSWSQSSVTWTSQPQTSYNANALYSVSASLGYHDFNVAQQVQTMVNNRLSYGLALVETNDLSNSTTRQFGIASLEYSPSLAAYLTVEYLP